VEAVQSISSRQETGRIEELQAALADPLDRVQRHPVYARIVTLDDLRVFMEHHVWAVWDFMNLVKAIQQRYTAMTIPWVPRGDATVRRFVNEIVLEEESDEHPFDGEGFCSHFELYIGSMAEAGASTTAVERFVGALAGGVAFPDALAASGCSEAIAHFLATTWSAARGDDDELLAAFAFGRETVIPVMFDRILAESGAVDDAGLLRHYLVRHVQLDGDSHSQMAKYLLTVACGDDPQRWVRAEASARRCLEARARLWDAVGELVTAR
jgi:hypothetical protein